MMNGIKIFVMGIAVSTVACNSGSRISVTYRPIVIQSPSPVRISDPVESPGLSIEDDLPPSGLPFDLAEESRGSPRVLSPSSVPNDFGFESEDSPGVPSTEGSEDAPGQSGRLLGVDEDERNIFWVGVDGDLPADIAAATIASLNPLDRRPVLSSPSTPHRSPLPVFPEVCSLRSSPLSIEGSEEESDVGEGRQTPSQSSLGSSSSSSDEESERDDSELGSLFGSSSSSSERFSSSEEEEEAPPADSDASLPPTPVVSGRAESPASTAGTEYDILEAVEEPLPINGLVAGAGFTLASRNRTAFAWGKGTEGQLGLGSLETQGVPHQVQGLDFNILEMAAGSTHSCFTVGTEVWCVGDNRLGQLGNGERGGQRGAPLYRNLPVRTPFLRESHGTREARSTRGAKKLFLGINVSCALAVQSGRVWCWGDNRNHLLSLGEEASRHLLQPREVVGLPDHVTHMSIRNSHACVVARGGQVWCWGRNEHGQLGNLSQAESRVPVLVRGLPDRAVQVEVGMGFSCARLMNGSVYCWGQNNHGQLGRGSLTDYERIPQRVHGLGEDRGVSDLRVGSHHACALNQGALRCWGMNDEGQLGEGSLVNRSEAVPVHGLDADVLFMALGGKHTCAVLTRGRIRCVGSNQHGQLGNRSFINSRIPVDVADF